MNHHHATTLAKMSNVRVGTDFVPAIMQADRLNQALTRRLKRGHDPEIAVADKTVRVRRIWLKLKQGVLDAVTTANVQRDYARQFAQF